MQTASAAPCRENVRTILTAHESVAPLRSSRKIAGEIASASREHAAAPQVSSQSSRPYPASVCPAGRFLGRAVGREGVEDAAAAGPG